MESNTPIPLKPEEGFSHRFKFKHGQEVILTDTGMTGFVLCRSDHGLYNMYRIYAAADGGYLDDFIPECLLEELKPKPVKKAR